MKGWAAFLLIIVVLCEGSSGAHAAFKGKDQPTLE